MKTLKKLDLNGIFFKQKQFYYAFLVFEAK